MCGIAGFSGTGDGATLIAMGKTITHRGPDQSGVHMDHSRNLRDVGLAHQRLSILDLSESGVQPMSNEDQTVWVAFNGEIYNFKELRLEIENKSVKNKHIWKSETDTEVIIHLYEECGEKVFAKLQGMFAIAIYDKKKDILILARDRMGKKPLYWGIVGENAKSLIFASELKSLHKHPLFEKKLSMKAFHEYFFSEHISTPNCIFDGINKLEPAHYIIWNGKDIKKECYWRAEYGIYKKSFNDSVQDLDTIMNHSVAERMIADVPVGIFLSGGIDSSTIAWYAKQKNKNIETFSIGFEDNTFDESIYANEVAKHLGTTHHNRIVTEKELLEIIPNLAEICDEPMADSSIIPTTILSQWARERVTVTLGGDGGDELFYGYDTFTAHKLAKLFSWVPTLIIDTLEKIVNLIPTSFSNMSFDFKIKNFIKGLREKDIVIRNELWMSAFKEGEIENLISKDLYKNYSKERTDDIENILNSETSYRNDYDRLGRAYERFYMLDHVLVKVDRASMRYALEVRAPFLSTEMVDFAHSLPPEFKMSGFNRKAILKSLMKGRLPDSIINRKKKGFGMPVAKWLNGPLKPLLTKYSSKKYLERQGLFNFDYIQRLISEHTSTKVDHRKKLWTLLMFQLWWDKWMK